jgi:hypothetical protein
MTKKKTDVPANPVGAPRKLDGGKRKLLYLDAASIEEALRLNPDNVSEGVRMALAASAERHRSGKDGK